MTKLRCQWLCIGLLLAGSVRITIGSEPTTGTEPTGAGIELFERSIRPVLVEHCYRCHSDEGDEIQGGLRLTSRAGLLAGGDSGPAIDLTTPDASLLLRALRHAGPAMPPGRRLPDEVIDTFATWIAQGAPDPRPTALTSAVVSVDQIDWSAARSFWAFRPPGPATLVPISNPSRAQTRHDRLVIAALDRQQLMPQARAADATLLRRLSFDLLGLPPQPEFRTAATDSAGRLHIARYVDLLLARPQYGEHWARLWLDLSRYAEDQAHIVGDDKELFYPNAYRYRDWVINSLNRDLPYDEFVRQQLAADLLDASSSQLAALGFIGLGPKYYDRKRLEVMAEEWEDRVDTVCRSLLGLTVACARCHDHKFDPIPTTDYYALASVFASTEMFNRPLSAEGIELREGHAKNPADALHVVRDREPRDLTVFVRGNVQQPGERVQRGFLTVFSTGDRQSFTQGSGRLELAERIVARDNPLTARVFVNRVWARLIGHPLVATPSNFGHQGGLPSHPELLDDLAVRFMEHDWSIKWLIREITTSATYLQSSDPTPASLDRDPANQWLSHMHRKRLHIEAWRDSLLSAADQLDTTVGGPSIDPSDSAIRRRTVYAFVSRFEQHPMLATFDFPDANVHADQRTRTTTPLQKLFTINHPWMIQQAEAIVDSVAQSAQTTPATLSPAVGIPAIYRRLLSRSPTTDEIRLGEGFLAGREEEAGERWIEYAHALLASNEAQFID